MKATDWLYAVIATAWFIASIVLVFTKGPGLIVSILVTAIALSLICGIWCTIARILLIVPLESTNSRVIV